MVKKKTQPKGAGPVREHRSKDNQWFYTVNARNGQVLVTSETYKTRAAMVKGIRALRRAMEA